MEPPSEIKNSVKHHVHKVIIIGAGISGLSAARHFIKNRIFDILILEATHKAGGRIDTIPFGDKKSGLVEKGAQWIHGEQNEFCQLVKSSDHRHVKTSWEGKGDFLCLNGVKIENKLVDEVLGWIEDTIEQVEATFTIESLQQRQPEVLHNSMGQYLRDSFISYLRDNHPESEDGSPEYNLRMALFQWGMSFQRIDNSCNKMNDVSLYRWAEFEVNPGEHYNNFARGAQSFVDEILIGTTGAKVDNFPFKIVYNSPVENISWKHENGQDIGQVKVTTTNGNVYEAECVLVTCSIGVLKSKMESLFTPKLPDNLSKAIKCTGFGPVTKIFLEWSQPWWPSDLKGFQLVWPEEFIDCCDSNSESNEPLDTRRSLDDNWHKTITGFDPVLDNPNVLLAWLGGPEAVHAESLSEKEISDKCVQVLKNFTGIDLPPPQSVAVSKWNTNQFFQGAYSFRAVDGDNIAGDICAILCEPIIVKDTNDLNKPVIVFAGEALSKSHYSTLHGAFESGISQASKIIQYFQALTSASSASNSFLNKSTTSCAPCKSTAKTCRFNSSDENSQSFKSGTGEKFTFSNKEVIQVPS